MVIRKYENSFYYVIFYFLLILLIISFRYSNIAIAQSTDQQQSADTTEHFSLVLPLDPEGEATVNYSFQQNNLFAFIYGKSNLRVLDLEDNHIVYEISDPDYNFFHPYLLENYLIYLRKSGQSYETICVNLSTEEPEIIIFPGSFRQTTDDGYLITSQAYKFQLIGLEEEQVLFEPEVSKGGEILCVDDVIIFPFDDSRGNNAGYKAMSTNGGEVKFTLEESFNEVRIFLPEYHSKISTFPLPILICNNYNDPSEKQWLLKFINKEGQTITSYSLADLGIEYAYEYLAPTPFRILDENQNNILIQIRYYKQGEPQGYYYILTNLSGNILKIFDENVFDETNAGGFDHQGNILLFQNRDGPLRDILNYYQQDGTLIFGKQIPSVVISRNFKFLSDDEILAWTYNQFEKYSLTSGELTGIYPISRDYQIYLDDTIAYNDQVYFFAKSRDGVEPPITGSNLFSFSTADSGWLNIELVFIKPNAGTIYEVYNNTDVRVKFKTEYGSNFGKNFTVNFEKGTASATNNNLEYIWHTPIILNGNEDTSKIIVSYGPVSQEFIITIKNHLPTASFTFTPPSPHTGQNVRFDASLSADLDGEITAYHWNFGDGTEERGQPQNYIDHIFSTAGDYIVNLEVTDNNGQTATISKNIQVTATNYEFSSYLSNFPYSGGNGEFTVSPSYSDCQWTAETDVSWIQINSGCTGLGNKILIFSVQYNSVEEERVGHITIEDKIYTITQEPKITITIPYPQPNGVSIPFLTSCRGACGSGCPDTCVSLPDITIRVADPLSDMSHYLLTYTEVTSCGTHAGCRWHDACFDQCKLWGEDSDVGPLHDLCSEKVVERYGPVDGGNWALGYGPYDGYFLFSNEPTQDGPFPGDVHSFPEANYRIIVYTGGLMFAGTDANVYITLFGTDGSSSTETLLDNVDTNNFEKGSQDLFYVRLKNFEDINRIRLRHDNSFSIPDNILIRDLIPDNILIRDLIPGDVTTGDLINTPLRDLIPDNIPIGDLLPSNTPLRDLIPDNIPIGDLIPENITIGDLIPENLLAGWYVDKVRIINDDTGQLWHFRAKRWLAEDEEDGRIDVEFPLSYKDERDYQIEVYTGNQIGDGTNANIYITLYGSNGFNTGNIHLNYPYQNNFEAEDQDTFCFIRAANIGELDHITLFSDNFGIGSDWYCEKIKVKEVTQSADDGEWYIPGWPPPPNWVSDSGRVWVIPVNNWLTEDNPTRTCYPQ